MIWAATVLSLALPQPLPPTWVQASLVVGGDNTPQFSDAAPRVASVVTRDRRYATNVSGIENLIKVFVPESSELVSERLDFGRHTIAQLLAYRSLEENWDYAGAEAVRPDAVNDAIRMIEVMPTTLGAPKPMVLASGDVAIYWENGAAYAEIGFNGDGTYYAFGECPGLPSVHLDDVLLTDNDGASHFPRQIEEILQWKPTSLAA